MPSDTIEATIENRRRLASVRSASQACAAPIDQRQQRRAERIDQTVDSVGPNARLEKIAAKCPRVKAPNPPPRIELDASSNRPGTRTAA